MSGSKSFILRQYLLIAIIILIITTPLYSFFARVQTTQFTNLEGVAVRLSNPDTTLFTDYEGQVYFLPLTGAQFRQRPSRPTELGFANGKFKVSLPKGGRFGLAVYSLSGRQMFKISETLPPGMHALLLPAFAKGIYLVRATVNGTVFLSKISFCNSYKWLVSVPAIEYRRGLAKSINTTDSACFTKEGYNPVCRKFISLDDSLGLVIMDLSATASATTIAVFAGGSRSAFLRQDGTIWASGEFCIYSKGQYSSAFASVPVLFDVKSAALQTQLLMVKRDGTLWNWFPGNEDWGDRYSLKIHEAQQVMEDVNAVSSISEHTMVIKTDGTLWATGKNETGQLGTGDTITRHAPVRVMEGVSAVSAGWNHTMILKPDGTLYAAGQNDYGQLGDGSTINKSSPVQVMNNVRAVSAGVLFTMIIKTDGTLWATGLNNRGQLGTGDSLSIKTPVQIMSNVRSVSTGFQTMIVRQDNTLWATGLNDHGQLGIGDTLNRFAPVKVMDGVQSVSTGLYHTIVLKLDSTVYGMGNNLYGEFGDGTCDLKPVKLPRLIWPVRRYGLTVSGGRNSGTYMPGITIGIAPIDSTSWGRGFDHWGGPDSSLLFTTEEGTFIEIPDRNVIVKAVFTDLPYLTVEDGCCSSWMRPGTMTVIHAGDSSTVHKVFDHWGGPDSSLAKPDTVLNAFVTMPSRSATLKAIYYPGCTVTFDRNGGNSEANPVQSRLISPGRRFLTSLPAPPWRTGYWFLSWNRLADGTGAVFEDTSIVQSNMIVYAQWANRFTGVTAGAVSSFIIGQGDVLWRTAPYPLIFQRLMSGVAAVSSSSTHTLILKHDGTLFGTGNNAFGELCNDTVFNDTTALLKLLSNVKSVSAGNGFTMIVKNDMTLWGAGWNNCGQLGNGDKVTPKSPVKVMSGVKSVICGSDFTLVIRQDNTLWAIGHNNRGQLGTGDTLDRNTPVQIMSDVSTVTAGYDFSLILKTDNSLWGTGASFRGQFGLQNSTVSYLPEFAMDSIAAVSAGFGHTLIIRQDHTLWATGSNSFGQLGDNSKEGKTAPVKIMENVAAVSAGNSHTIILKQDGTVWTTGNNSNRQLGDGTIVNKYAPVKVSP
jgi:alpha-tubulin suppressor-like RCC1 family protein